MENDNVNSLKSFLCPAQSFPSHRSSQLVNLKSLEPPESSSMTNDNDLTNTTEDVYHIELGRSPYEVAINLPSLL